LREVAIRRGVDIYEHSAMRRFSRSRPVEVQCANGTVRSDVLILATNAWSASIAELSRSIVVVSSDMIASQPVPQRLDSIGWRDGAGVNGSQTMVDYVRTSVSGRVFAGKGGLAFAYGGCVHARMFHSPRRAAIVHRAMRRLYPAFAGFPIDCSWSGPVDRSSDGLPILGRLPRNPNVLYGIGWSGNGVGPSRIGGRALASMALGQEDEWSTLPIVGALRRDMPAEPWRFLGAHVVRAAVRRKDLAEANDRQPGRMVRALAALAPRGVED
jgi:glycine/D-amino acid oxidase-like deaminating enzyme